MSKKIIIENLKNVDRLEFELPAPGVWLLTGENGCGKTTLLAAIHRLGFPNAFATHFPASVASDRLDDMSRASVTFQLRQRQVTYRRAGVRWVPTPRREAALLRAFNYSSVEFVGVDADRISPKEEDFVPARVRAVAPRIIAAANHIFATSRFQTLRTVNVTRGSNPAYVFAHGPTSARKYSSEKSFSVGELCVLKLLKKLDQCEDNSLFLIDELEMALPPSAQARMFDHIEECALEKNLTVIFSTHSVTLIKSANRNRILFIRSTDEGLSVVKGPYPSVVLGSLASVEERAADTVVYVEDTFAEAALDPLLSAVASEKLGEDPFVFPKVVVVPVGGFREVVHFLRRHDALMRPGIKCYAVLDADVKEETLVQWRQDQNHEMLAWFARHQDRIKYLPWTPEVGLKRLYDEDTSKFLEKIRTTFNDQTLQMPQAVTDQAHQLESAELRRACKTWTKHLTDFIREQTMLSEAEIAKGLGAILSQDFFERQKNSAMRDYAPML